METRSAALRKICSSLSLGEIDRNLLPSVAKLARLRLAKFASLSLGEIFISFYKFHERSEYISLRAQRGASFYQFRVAKRSIFHERSEYISINFLFAIRRLAFIRKLVSSIFAAFALFALNSYYFL